MSCQTIKNFVLFQVAFDKHWNLAMVDVDERYVRKRFPKTSLFDVNAIANKFNDLSVKNDDRKSRKAKSKKVVKREQVFKSLFHLIYKLLASILSFDGWYSYQVESELGTQTTV